MAGTSDFLPFATDVSAEVISQAAYVAAPETPVGFSVGPANNLFLNKVWRQASFIAAGLAQWLANATNTNVADDGDLAGFVTKISGVLGSGQRAYRAVSADTAVAITDSIIEVDATAGAKTVTYDPALAMGLLVVVVKGDATGNAVNINDLSGTVATITVAAAGAVKASARVYSDGAALSVLKP